MYWQLVSSCIPAAVAFVGDVVLGSNKYRASKTVLQSDGKRSASFACSCLSETTTELAPKRKVSISSGKTISFWNTSRSLGLKCSIYDIETL
jgi:hypothetical protein